MIYDPATDTFSINYGHAPPPEGPLQREWTPSALPFSSSFWHRSGWLYQGCEKFHEWQQDRTYAFQEEVLKQPPVAVMVCKVGCPGYSTEELSKLRVVSRQPSQENGAKWDLIVLAPSKGENASGLPVRSKAASPLMSPTFLL